MDSIDTPISTPNVINLSGGENLIVPGGWLLKADFIHQGPDLLLIGADGQHALIPGYFTVETPPNLVTDFGAMISADLAAKLAGPANPAQYAQATATSAAEPIGRIETLSGSAEVTHSDGSKAPLAQGAPIFSGDVIETGDSGAVGIVLADDSTLSLAESGRMVMDDVVYDPSAQTGNATISIVQGVFSFVSGQIAKTGPDAMVLKTPVATLGIRGTKVAGSAAAEGEQNTISLLPDADGSVGEIAVSNGAGTIVLNVAGATTQMTSAFVAPPPPVILPVAQIQQQFSAALRSLPPTPAPQNQNNDNQGEGEGEPGEGDAPPEGEGEPQEGEAPPEGEGEPGEGEVPPEEGEVPLEEGEVPPEGEGEEPLEEGEVPLEEGDAPPEGEGNPDEAASTLAGEAPPPDGAGPDGPSLDGQPDGDGAPEQAFQQALADGASQDDAFEAAADAAIQEAIANGATQEEAEAAVAAAEVAYRQALADGLSPEQALQAAGEAAGQAVPGIDGPNQDGGQTNTGGTDQGGTFQSFNSDPFGNGSFYNDGGGESGFFYNGGGGDLIGGTGGDILGGDGEFFDYGGEFFDFGFGLGPVEENYFDLTETFEFTNDDFGQDHEDIVTTFDEVFSGTAANNPFVGSTLNTSYYFTHSAIGGADTISDAGGANQISFDGLNDTVIKFTIDGSLATSGNVEIWGGGANTGYTSISGSDATYTLTSTPYSSAADSTIAFSDIGQYLFADTVVASLAGGYTTHSSEDTSAAQSDADYGDVLVMPSLQTSDIGMVIAGGSGADTFNLDDTGVDGMIVFGKGGGDTFNIKTASDGLFIGGITTTDNNDNSGSDGIPDANLNIFSYSTLYTSVAGITADIFGFVDPNSSVNESTGLVSDKATGTTLSNILWDVGAFEGSAGDDTILVSGSYLNYLDAGAGDDEISLDSGAKLLTLTGGTGTNTVAIDGTYTFAMSTVGEVTGSATADSLTLTNAQTGLDIDLGGASDSLNLSVSGNSVAVSNVESIVSSAGSNTVSLGTNLSAATVSLTGGGNVLNLGVAGSHTGSIAAETINGVTGSDNSLVLTNVLTGSSIDLGATSTGDALSLNNASGGYSLTVSNAETITGSSGVDTLTIGGSNATQITANAGNDTLILNGSGAHTVVFSSAATNGVDSIQGFLTGASGDILSAAGLGLSGAGTGTGTTTSAEILTSDAGLTSDTTVAVFDGIFLVDSTDTTVNQITAFITEINTNGATFRGSLGANDSLLFVVDDSHANSDLGLWHWNDTDGGADVDSNEITVVGQLDAINANTINTANFA